MCINKTCAPNSGSTNLKCIFLYLNTILIYLPSANFEYCHRVCLQKFPMRNFTESEISNMYVLSIHTQQLYIQHETVKQKVKDIRTYYNIWLCTYFI